LYIGLVISIGRCLLSIIVYQTIHISASLCPTLSAQTEPISPKDIAMQHSDTSYYYQAINSDCSIIQCTFMILVHSHALSILSSIKVDFKWYVGWVCNLHMPHK